MTPATPPNRFARTLRLAPRVLALLLLSVFAGGALHGYSVLTHEEIVDLVWTDELRPLLLQRYPGLTAEQLVEAHAYAYGGAVIQDLGYYPFGDLDFSLLLHYVRSGDFVVELCRASQDVNEYAFALGALSHYVSDYVGHPVVNHAVALQYPKLMAKFGDPITFAQAKTAHLRIELGFDMVQVAKNRYASEQYHAFIGFKVSKPLLERVFPVIYGLELKEVLTRGDLAIGSYRFFVSLVIPKLIKVALKAHPKDTMKEAKTPAKQLFLYRLSRSEYDREWGKDFQRPGVAIRLLAFVLQFAPKIGPFRAMAFNNPTPETEELYFKSINATVDQYRIHLHELKAGHLLAVNCNLDDGHPAEAGSYTLADGIYAKLMAWLSAKGFQGASPALRQDLLRFYARAQLPDGTRAQERRWRATQAALTQLQTLPEAPVAP